MENKFCQYAKKNILKKKELTAIFGFNLIRKVPEYKYLSGKRPKHLIKWKVKTFKVQSSFFFLVSTPKKPFVEHKFVNQKTNNNHGHV